jgi:hypothetical protein
MPDDEGALGAALGQRHQPHAIRRHASHACDYTPDEPDYYELADIFASAAAAPVACRHAGREYGCWRHRN